MSEFGTPEFLGLFGLTCLVIVVVMWLAMLGDEFRRRWRASGHKTLRAAWRNWRAGRA